MGEVLRRIVGKVISLNAKSEIREAAGLLQTCASYGGRAEAAIHSMRDIFSEEPTEGILLIDALNAFNRMNRAAALHNIQNLCPKISTYLSNTHRSPTPLFIAAAGNEASKMAA